MKERKGKERKKELRNYEGEKGRTKEGIKKEKQWVVSVNKRSKE